MPLPILLAHEQRSKCFTVAKLLVYRFAKSVHVQFSFHSSYCKQRRRHDSNGVDWSGRWWQHMFSHQKRHVFSTCLCILRTWRCTGSNEGTLSTVIPVAVMCHRVGRVSLEQTPSASLQSRRYQEYEYSTAAQVL